MTLVELMVVVSIIGISALAFTPGIMRAIATQEKEQAVRMVALTAAQARTNSMIQRRAYLMWVQYGGSDTVAPKVQVLRAATSSCISQNWVAMQAQCGAAHEDGTIVNGTSITHLKSCVANFDFGTDTRYSTRGFNIRAVEEVTNGSEVSTNRAICFSPDGVIYTSNALTMTTLNSYNTVGGAIKMVFRLRDHRANFVGVDQRVVIPITGAPKVLQ